MVRQGQNKDILQNMLTNCILQVSLTFCGKKPPFFFTRSTHDYVPISHCNHYSIQHNQDALPALTLLLFQCLAAFLDKAMSSPPHHHVVAFDQLKGFWNSLQAKNKPPLEDMSSLKVRNIKHRGQSEETQRHPN